MVDLHETKQWQYLVVPVGAFVCNSEMAMWSLLNKNNASHEVLPAQPTLSTFWDRSISINCFNHMIIINDKTTELPRTYVKIKWHNNLRKF